MVGKGQFMRKTSIGLGFATIFAAFFLLTVLVPDYVVAVSPTAIFAGGDDCAVDHAKDQFDASGSNLTVNGGVHSNDNYNVSGGSNNWNGPFTHVNTSANNIGSPQTSTRAFRWR